MSSDAPGREPAEAGPQRWSLGTRLAFRLCFLYFGLSIVFGQMLTTLLLVPGVHLPELGLLTPMRPLVAGVAKHVFQIGGALVVTGSGSGDKTFDWVEAFCLLSLASLGTLLWSVLDRRRASDVALHSWFHLVTRFAMGSTLLLYGVSKLFPIQMPFPSLDRLVEPFGNFSPMGVLWSSIGAAPAYEIFLGGAEVLTGVLVLLPRTATLGACLCLADAIQVFVFNMTYDIPVKLFSFHIILLALFLLAPDARRLADFFLLNRASGPSRQRELFHKRRGNRIAAVTQIVVAVYLVGMYLYLAGKDWREYGDGASKPPLYGIWSVEEMAVDGMARPPLLTDRERWRRVVFPDSQRVIFQAMDDSFMSYGASVNTLDKVIALGKRADDRWKTTFRFERPAQDRLVLDGEMDRHRIHLQLRLVDREKLPLVSRGFHWIQEYPLNR